MEQKEIDKIREFNRNYLLILGLLNDKMRDLTFSLTEGRILFEIGNDSAVVANRLAVKLQVDRSYLNRLVNKLARKGLLEKQPSATDGRINLLKLTAKGKAALDKINYQNEELTAELFSQFSAKELQKIIASMELIMSRLAQADK